MTTDRQETAMTTTRTTDVQLTLAVAGRPREQTRDGVPYIVERVVHRAYIAPTGTYRRTAEAIGSAPDYRNRDVPLDRYAAPSWYERVAERLRLTVESPTVVEPDQWEPATPAVRGPE